MFYCEECGKKRGWPFERFHLRSRGTCELCERVAECVDVPSAQLPVPKATRVELAEARLAAARKMLLDHAPRVISWQGKVAEERFPKLLGEVVLAAEELTKTYLVEQDYSIAEEVDASNRFVEQLIERMEMNGHTIDNDDRALLFNSFAECVTYVLENQRLHVMAKLVFVEELKARVRSLEAQVRALESSKR